MPAVQAGGRPTSTGSPPRLSRSALGSRRTLATALTRRGPDLATLTSRLIKLQGGLFLRAIVDTEAAANNQTGPDLSNVRSIA
jgi:hypothetical protein